MKICVAQTRPLKGNIEANIRNHKKSIDVAVSNGADMIIFPELSLTGYETTLAKGFATDLDDKRFNDFQKISDSNQITIGVGMPIKKKDDIMIGMIIFQPNKPRQLYCKQHLHSDELPFFAEGTEQVYLNENENKAALAICYEISILRHPETAFVNHAKFYLASVAKTAESVERATITLAETARKYSMTVMMANCIGPCDDFISAGKSAVWDNTGVLVGQLDDVHEGLLIFDTETGELGKEIFSDNVALKPNILT